MKKLLLATAASLLISNAAPTSAEYDIVIRGGRVLDGAGNPWVLADVAIKDGRIVKVGQVVEAGRKEVDARGRYVSPGFIDMQDQSGRGILDTGTESKLRQGVTSLIAGEGGTPVPADEIAGWFGQMEKKGIPVNFGTYYGAVQARSKVMADRAGTPTPEQIEVMRQEVATAMRAGVFGISTALIYAPATFQSKADLIELAKVAGQCGGFYVTHMRDESDKLLPAIQEAIEIGEGGGTKIEIYHLKAAYQPKWGKLMPQAVAAIEAARARRRHHGGYVCLHCGWHGPERHRAQLGVGGRPRQGTGAAARSSSSSADQERGRGRVAARLVQPGRRIRRMGPCHAGRLLQPRLCAI